MSSNGDELERTACGAVSSRGDGEREPNSPLCGPGPSSVREVAQVGGGVYCALGSGTHVAQLDGAVYLLSMGDRDL